VRCATQLLAAAQAALVAADPDAARHLVDPAAAHVTLAVLRAGPDDATALDRARGALETAAAAVRAGGALSLAVRAELCSFPPRDRVAYLPVDDGAGGAALAAAAAAVEAALRDAGLGAEEEDGDGDGDGDGGDADARPARRRPPRPFTPHLTVAKIIVHPGRRRRPPRTGLPVAAAAVAAFDGVPPPPPWVAGELELCALGGRPVGQYYEVVAAAPLG
jgi:2'-5' RNA ligase